MDKKSDGNGDILDWLGLTDIPNWTVARTIGPLLTVIVFCLFILALFSALAVLLKLVFGGGAPTLGAGTLIAAVLGSPFLIWGTALKHRTVSFQKEGHITDRITKATEQLGAEKVVKKQLINSQGKKVFNKGIDGKPDFSKPVMVEASYPNIEVRIGGILSLERIAQDSTSYDAGRDHVRVMEILCAYIRENSASFTELPLEEWKPLDKDSSEKQQEAQKAEIEKRIGMFNTLGTAYRWAAELPELRVDIQLALNVIGRRTEKQRAIEAAWPEKLGTSIKSPFETGCPQLPIGLDLERLRSDNTKVIAMRIEGWEEATRTYSGYRLDFRGANLQRADMSAKRSDGSDAVFSGCLFSGAKLDGASFENAQLRGAEFRKVSLNATNFNSADLAGSKFENFCQMEAVRFIRANLTSARFSEARMLGAVFTSANLDFAMIDSSVLEGGWFLSNQARFLNITATKCFGVQVTSADASMAKIQRAEHGLAIFNSSNTVRGLAVMEMDFSKLRNNELDYDLLFGDLSVSLPEEITPPPHWAKVNIGWLRFDEEFSKWHDDPSTYSPPISTD